MAEITIKNPEAEASYRQMGALGKALIEVAYPELTKGQASDMLNRLYGDDDGATEALLRKMAHDANYALSA